MLRRLTAGLGLVAMMLFGAVALAPNAFADGDPSHCNDYVQGAVCIWGDIHYRTSWAGYPSPERIYLAVGGDIANLHRFTYSVDGCCSNSRNANESASSYYNYETYVEKTWYFTAANCQTPSGQHYFTNTGVNGDSDFTNGSPSDPRNGWNHFNDTLSSLAFNEFLSTCRAGQDVWNYP